ncbi:MAG: lipocalin [Candidatus Melainabacteria bacterium HGW-Melainabacteria-1]|nr:MAG: lipocalin [Candidatus Melainabacteria bacterium HGW-Melainabacteria-1]
MKSIAKMAILAALALASASLWAETQKPLDLVPALDLDRYLGRWYEVARYQHTFEKSLVGATAEYSLRKDGKVDVLNSGFKNTLDGKYTDVKAVAWRPDDAIPGALKVKFFGLFTSDYLVFGLDDVDYQWALVGNNDRKFLWFLSRTPEVAPELLEKLKGIAEAQGYDLSKLFIVPQKAR